MKKRRCYLPMAFCALLSLTAYAQDVPERTSIIQLIATPEKFEGKFVVVTGYVNLEFEGNAIYLHRDDNENSLHRNGLWLDASSCKRRSGEKFSSGYALVIGRFTAKRHGHMSLWSGELQDVKTCQAWPNRPNGT